MATANPRETSFFACHASENTPHCRPSGRRPPESPTQNPEDPENEVMALDCNTAVDSPEAEIVSSSEGLRGPGRTRMKWSSSKPPRSTRHSMCQLPVRRERGPFPSLVPRPYLKRRGRRRRRGRRGRRRRSYIPLYLNNDVLQGGDSPRITLLRDLRPVRLTKNGLSICGLVDVPGRD